MLVGLEPWVLALFCGVAFVGFLASSTFGVGGALALTPILMVRFSPSEAVALAAPVMLFHNALKLLVFRRHLDVAAGLCVSATAVPAAAVGALFVDLAPERVLKAGVGLLIVASLVLHRGLSVELRVSRRALLSWGVGIGLISGLVSAAGPPTAVALRGYGLVKERFVATVALLAVLMQLAKVPTYVGTGVLPVRLWPLALLLAGVALFAVGLGRLLLSRIDARRFRLILDGLLAVMAAWLLGGALLG